MRTHLLRTFYPPSTLEPDTGRAANDDGGADTEKPLPPAASRHAVTLLVQPVEPANDEHDDYYLGGYAGI
jgi:hypothetical protein